MPCFKSKVYYFSESHFRVWIIVILSLHRGEEQTTKLFSIAPTVWPRGGHSLPRKTMTGPNDTNLFKRFTGVMTGTLILLGSVIVMTLLASIDSGIHNDMKSYNSEYKSLLIYDTFLVSANCANYLLIQGCPIRARTVLFNNALL